MSKTDCLNLQWSIYNRKLNNVINEIFYSQRTEVLDLQMIVDRLLKYRPKDVNVR